MGIMLVLLLVGMLFKNQKSKVKSKEILSVTLLEGELKTS
jgi:hypothetical protein